MIKRHLTKQILQNYKDNKAIIIIGARQVGKTTLLKLNFKDANTLWLNGDDFDVRQNLSKPNAEFLQKIIGNNTTLIIDEAQRIENIGLTLKIIQDQIKNVKLIATGSSAFELSNKINEPLTGRKWEYKLWPLSVSEMIAHSSYIEEQRLLNHRLIYGWYPDVINSLGKEKDILNQLSNSYLYKDILTWQDIKKPQKLEALLQALAFQIGNQISYHELGKLTGLNNETVERYIDLLEKAFIIFRLPSLSRNLRNELKKSKKIYFYDVGIRNAVIKNWNPVGLRQDIGALWENFLIVERLKFKANEGINTNDYFWRTQAQQEIDFIEDYNGKLYAYEFKWNATKKTKISKSFTKAYPNHQQMVVNQENYTDFISAKF